MTTMELNLFDFLISQVTVLAGGFTCGYAIKTIVDRRAVRGAHELKENARHEAETILKEARISAKEELLKTKDEFEKTTHDRRHELQKLEERLVSRESNIERKADLMDARQLEVDKRELQARQLEEGNRAAAAELNHLKIRQIQELERVAAITKEEARQQIINRLTDELEAERGLLTRRFQDEFRQHYEREAREIMITTMERYAGDCAYERTTATIPLPNDEMKGRIIGREGRNIRAIEAATGVSVLIDDTPEAVVISCFDPVRREIARLAMERLVSDGRIHPTRIEEMVEKVKQEVDNGIQKAGQEAVDQLGLTGIKTSLIKLLGRLKYRFSYSQNVLAHSVEVAYLMGGIAAQLGLDERKARRAGLFHDIGKAVDHEVEGSHALIGADLLKRNGEEDEIVSAVASHHGEQERGTAFGVLVELCDKLSASRPGARSETTELYLKRLEQLETIGKSFSGVENCYAIQAGRELRIIVEPVAVDENKAALLVHEVAKLIEKEMRYPGQIKVTVIRETRSVDYAK